MEGAKYVLDFLLIQYQMFALDFKLNLKIVISKDNPFFKAGVDLDF